MIRYIRLLGAALGGLVGLGGRVGERRHLRRIGLRRRAPLPRGSSPGSWSASRSCRTSRSCRRAWLIARVEELSTAEFVTAVIGLLLGLLMGLLLGFPLSQLPGAVGLDPAARRVAVPGPRDGRPDRRQAQGPVVAAEALGIFRRPATGHGRARAPASRTSSSTPARSSTAGSPEIVESGFIYGTLVVPRFVLDELQHIADSSDTLRRNRGRRGLEILTACRRTPARRSRSSRTTCPTSTRSTPSSSPSPAPQPGDPDQRLQPQPGRRAAGRARHEHQLAGERREAACCPARSCAVRVIQEGKEAGQGVGFLDDGTMIVVEGGARHIDKDLDVSVTRVLQTVAGRMIFAQPRLDDVGGDGAAGGRRRDRRRRRAVERMGGIDKLPAPIGGRPLLAWTLDALAAAAPVVERLVVVTSADGRERSPTRPGCRRAVAVVAGGATPPGLGRGRLPGSTPTAIGPDDGDGSSSSTTGPDRSSRRRSSRRSRGRGRARRRHPGPAGRRDPQARRRRPGRGDRRPVRAGRRPDAAGRSRRPAPRGVRAPFPPDGPDEFTDEAALLEACSIPVHAIPANPATSR